MFNDTNPSTDIQGLENTTPSDDERTAQIGIKGQKGKYLVLADAAVWHDESGFELSWLSQTKEHHLIDDVPTTKKEREDLEQRKADEEKRLAPKLGNWWVPVKDIPTNNTDLVKRINIALAYGILELTNDYEAWLIDQKKKTDGPKRQHRLVWSELDRQAVKEQTQIPRMPSLAKGTLSYGDKDSKAYKLLQQNAKELKVAIPQIVGALDKESRKEFTLQLLQIEQKGYNRSAAPRRDVIDTITEVRAGLGLHSGLTPIREDQPITSDVKPLRLLI